MSEYRKKPVVIEAIQFVGNNALEINAFTDSSRPTDESMTHNDWKRKQLIIPTLEGDMIASYGDWIIKGVKGEFYPCKPDIFAASYEAVTEPNELAQLRQSIAEKHGEIERLVDDFFRQKEQLATCERTMGAMAKEFDAQVDSLKQLVSSARAEAGRLQTELDASRANERTALHQVEVEREYKSKLRADALASALTTERMRDVIECAIDHPHWNFEVSCGAKDVLNYTPSPALAQVRDALEKSVETIEAYMAPADDRVGVAARFAHVKELSTSALTAARNALALMGGTKV